MKSKDRIKNRLLVDYALQHQPELIQQLLEDPSSFLERLGLDEEDLKCPEEAHQAFARGEAIVEGAKALGDISLADAFPKITELVRQQFGQDATVSKEPFGLRFSEKVRDVGRLAFTATGTYKITFGGLDHSGDVDG